MNYFLYGIILEQLVNQVRRQLLYFNYYNRYVPIQIAREIQDIKAGNNVTTKEDEDEEHIILLEVGSLTASEENALHTDIASR